MGKQLFFTFRQVLRIISISFVTGSTLVIRQCESDFVRGHTCLHVTVGPHTHQFRERFILLIASRLCWIGLSPELMRFHIHSHTPVADRTSRNRERR